MVYLSLDFDSNSQVPLLKNSGTLVYVLGRMQVAFWLLILHMYLPVVSEAG